MYHVSPIHHKREKKKSRDLLTRTPVDPGRGVPFTTRTLLNSFDSGGAQTATGAVDPPAFVFAELSPPQETRFVWSSKAPDSAVAVVERSAVAMRIIAERRVRSVVGFEEEDEDCERGGTLAGLAPMVEMFVVVV